MNRQLILVFNGTGSSGKSSAARALQELSAIPLLHFSMDEFLDMLPPNMWGHPDGITFRPSFSEGQKATQIDVGSVGRKLLAGFRSSVATMARLGNSMIVDDVMLGSEMDDYRQLLRGFDVRFVGFFASLDILESREANRGDRTIGLARAQYPLIKRGAGYDLEVDTGIASPQQIARLICDSFDLPSTPLAASAPLH